MVSITVSLDDSFGAKLEKYSWINWSEVARIEATKRELFERFIRVRALSKEDNSFCERINWHPTDELPLKKEFVKELKTIEKGRHSKAMSPEEFRKFLGKL